MPYAQIDDGVRLYYELTGPEDAPVVLQLGGGLFGRHNFGARQRRLPRALPPPLVRRARLRRVAIIHARSTRSKGGQTTRRACSTRVGLEHGASSTARRWAA